MENAKVKRYQAKGVAAKDAAATANVRAKADRIARESERKRAEARRIGFEVRRSRQQPGLST